MSRRDDASLETYGFGDAEQVDGYSKFVSDYLPVLDRRRQRWSDVGAEQPPGGLIANRKFKRFVRKGVPSAHRPAVWLACSGARSAMRDYPDRFEYLIARSAADMASVAQIGKDLHRTFPNNVHFREMEGESMRHQLDLLLRALAARHPSIGYCQGLNYVAALLLLVLRDAEDAYWLVDVTMPIVGGYYAHDMAGLICDMNVLDELLRCREPEISAKFGKLHIDTLLLCSKWFICWFIEVLPIETVLRVWDCFFNEGPKIFFRVALTLIIRQKSSILASRSMTDVTTLFSSLSSSPAVVDCHRFIADIFTVPGAMPWATIEELRGRHGHK